MSKSTKGMKVITNHCQTVSGIKTWIRNLKDQFPISIALPITTHTVQFRLVYWFWWPRWPSCREMSSNSRGPRWCKSRTTRTRPEEIFISTAFIDSFPWSLLLSLLSLTAAIAIQNQATNSHLPATCKCFHHHQHHHHHQWYQPHHHQQRYQRYHHRYRHHHSESCGSLKIK